MTHGVGQNQRKWPIVWAKIAMASQCGPGVVQKINIQEYKKLNKSLSFLYWSG